jgi:hypothetical protein
MPKHNAHVGYSKERRAIELVVPFGTKTTELSAIMSAVFRPGVLGPLGRGCQTCTSGDHLVVREELAELIEVNLEKVAR